MKFLTLNVISAILALTTFLSGRAADIEVRLSGNVEVIDTSGSIDASAAVVKAVDFDTNLVSIESEVRPDPDDNWQMIGQLSSTALAKITIIGAYADYINVRGPLVLEISEEKPYRRNINIQLRSRTNAASYIFDRCNAWNELGYTDTEIVNCLDEALVLDDRPVIQEAKADLMDKSGDWKKCATIFHNIADLLVEVKAQREKIADAAAREVFCLHRLGKEQAGEAMALGDDPLDESSKAAMSTWKNVADRAWFSVSNNLALGKVRALVFGAWLDALYYLADTPVGDDEQLVTAILANRKIRDQWFSLYYVNLQHLPVPLEIDQPCTLAALSRLAEELGRPREDTASTLKCI